MQRNLKLVIAYDGTDFHGWQAQPGMRTVQAELQKVLERVLRHRVLLPSAAANTYRPNGLSASTASS